MKIIALGDTHGRSFWKQVVATQTFDLLIFQGDYFDSWDLSVEEQIKNFLEICAYKRKHPNKVILLIGNHDFHYMPAALAIGEVYSGFAAAASPRIKEVLEENKDLLIAAYRHNNYLFTHAGVTRTWIQRSLSIDEEDEVDFLEIDVADYINDVFKYSPKYFFFTGNDPYGDDVSQSPIWVRPASLNKDALPFIHVVGHTGQKRIGIEPTKLAQPGAQAFFIDVLGSSREYLIIENDIARVGSLSHQNTGDHA